VSLRRRMYLNESADISSEDVIDILAQQRGNSEREREDIARWVVSKNFKLTTVHVWLPDLGVTAGKTGETRSEGKPIIVDDNVRQVARFQGSFGAAPDFLVLDGQNRVIKAREKGHRTEIDAYVGDKIFNRLKEKDKKFGDVFVELQNTIDEYLSGRSGFALGSLKRAVERGLMTQDELDKLRAKWKAKHDS